MSKELEQASQAYRSYNETLQSGVKIEIDPSFLNSHNQILRHAMADILCGDYYDNIQNFESSLDRILNDQEPKIRSRGLFAIQRHFHKFPEQAAELIKHHLTSEAAEVRVAATNALGERFLEIESAEALLSKQLKDLNPLVRISGLRAVDNNYTSIYEVEEILANLSKDSAPEVRMKVLDVIHNHRKSFDDFLAWITPFTGDESEEVRGLAGGILWSAAGGRILDPDKTIRTFIKNDSPRIRRQMVLLVMNTIDRITNPHEIVIEGLKDPDPTVKINALWVLEKRTWQLIPYCINELNQLCEDEDYWVRNEAIWIKNEILKIIKRQKKAETDI